MDSAAGRRKRWHVAPAYGLGRGTGPDRRSGDVVMPRLGAALAADSGASSWQSLARGYLSSTSTRRKHGAAYPPPCAGFRQVNNSAQARYSSRRAEVMVAVRARSQAFAWTCTHGWPGGGLWLRRSLSKSGLKVPTKNWTGRVLVACPPVVAKPGQVVPHSPGGLWSQRPCAAAVCYRN